mmetsp:Transcript_22322/g.36239  ORF Transcript_22322/g.36239 Transcript_22322/m.36239 type:complete len:130 (-) Transcript_22322:223-612(-)|eukprot:CAMPEP_0196130488 /NCGR_PEP_ID=MMETSP0910-20130528/836_1 /TAXON_ID=49265 /ORGANISM="Thalassiosira rotula, Strain GSO102" /LENGTH=129 /DNA_ID=CAMNT_0041389799 /DNA_START=157 /DNA_END=546 /DNA_ORIENTATION=+
MPFGDPKFTVVNPSPDVDMCIRALRFSDYLSAAALSGGTWAYGYLLGKPTRFASANTAMMIGMTAASMMVMQNTRSRLRGYRENAHEVKKYGAWHEQPDLKQLGTTRFPIANGGFSTMTKPPLNWKNYD